MAKSKLATTKLDAAIFDLTQSCDHKTLAIWAADCAERVARHFEVIYPNDPRVRNAIEASRSWVKGKLAMTDARKAAFAAHAAAREAETSPDAQAAARSAGHAAATAHVQTHAVHAATYAVTAIRNATQDEEVTTAMEHEREWQYAHLLELSKTDS